MTLPQTKEREYRFKLALRMVLPIFTLIIAFIINSLISTNEQLTYIFYIELTLILFFSIYFIFYLIYKGFDTKITDNVSKVFSREYLYNYLEKEIKNSKEYSLLLISIDNLNEINSRYGMNSGDKILFEVVVWIEKYFKEKNIENFPIGHLKGGDFVIGLKGKKNDFKTTLELFCLKSEELKIDSVEVQISAAINDITLSKDINYLIENLFYLQKLTKNYKNIISIEDETDPNELEFLVIDAINKKNIEVVLQDVFEGDIPVVKECFIKLKTVDNKLIYPKIYMKFLDKLRITVKYDLMILEKIISLCTEYIDEVFAISISPTSIRNPLFIAKVKELFYKNSSIKNRVVFILSESEYYPFIENYNNVLQTLRAFGIIIVIDRLGSLNSSFLYLRDLDIDIVRFDSLYTKETNQIKYKNIIDGFNTMAHNKGVKSWVKMVENESSYKTLKEQNIDYIQGKYLAPLEKI